MSRVVGGRYELGELIASDGGGELWQATDNVLFRTVAVRLTSTVNRPAARALGQISHHCIARVYDYGDGFVVVEHVAGQRFTPSAQTPAELLRIFVQLAVGLGQVHQAGVAHGDIKLTDLIVRPDGTVVLTGFALTGSPASAAADLDRLGSLAAQCLSGLAGAAGWAAPGRFASASDLAEAARYLLIELGETIGLDEFPITEAGDAWPGAEPMMPDRMSEHARPVSSPGGLGGLIGGLGRRSQRDRKRPADPGSVAPPPPAPARPASPASTPAPSQRRADPGGYGSAPPAPSQSAPTQGSPQRQGPADSGYGSAPSQPAPSQPVPPTPWQGPGESGGYGSAQPYPAAPYGGAQGFGQPNVATGSFKMTVGYPKRVAKGRASAFTVQIHLPEGEEAAAQRLLEAFGDNASGRVSSGQQLPLGRDVSIALSSPDVEFSAPKQWQVSPSGIDAAFFGRPGEDARPGVHAGILTVTETGSQRELASMPFTITIADFALGKMSRPTMRGVVTGVLVVASVGILGYSFINQVQEVMGVVTGVVGAAISAVVTVRTTALYSRKTAGATTTVPMS